jgi:hypothetical protein
MFLEARGLFDIKNLFMPSNVIFENRSIVVCPPQVPNLDFCYCLLHFERGYFWQSDLLEVHRHAHGTGGPSLPILRNWTHPNLDLIEP